MRTLHPSPTERWAPPVLLTLLCVLLVLYLGGSYLHDQGVEAGRAEERRSLQTYCELAALGASAGAAVAICAERAMSGE